MIRTRLASEVPFETVSMEFLRDENDPSSWEPLTSGSPGQRSAAMLSFMATLLVGFIYAWGKGAFEWER